MLICLSSALVRRWRVPLLTMLSIFLLDASAWGQTRWGESTDRSRGFDFGSNWQGNDWLGDASKQNHQWLLGVTGDNLDTGVLVRNVASNSAAARARIEVGDTIVTAGGFQVGSVNGRVYDLAQEINARADASGYISLVIQDHRNGQLASVRVKLDDRQTTLRGTLVYSERSALPDDAIVTVLIENLTRPYYTVHNGQTAFRPARGSSIPFEIAYDPAYVNAQDSYQVRAFVTSGGRTILDTRQPQRVLTNGAASQVRMQLTPVGRPGAGSVVSVGYPNYNDLDDQLVSMYRKYLRRDPTSAELAALRLTPGINARMDSMPMELMAAQEYYDASGNNNSVWLERVFQEIVQRRPSSSEMEQWMQRFGELRYSRTELLRQLYSQVRR
ncbi:MAG: YbaY family lipoprotein [Planctomycetales bacterium]|nr:YbaY family lipoprotein [Planctomycetales bacterium]